MRNETETTQLCSRNGIVVSVNGGKRQLGRFFERLHFEHQS
ncbi:hypothetical protein [Endozoicomonas euniceicola]|uniref:Uncharacterized protein n=1 Tax=Endozoicomonas euniceicola TaxID=1234143 RepID=A0ABY6GV40_9GAMM|nr:hypothetical protein [Endozoicomonas euniceicola]UYM15829.1 hypothetical protein NX720_23890 [Endozoicomonas euniceicola]